MANVLNILLKNTALCPIKQALKTSAFINVIHSRTLYSKATLGVEQYEQQRERTKNQLENIMEKFKLKMIEYTSDDSKNMIFTEDLKNMIHLAENDDVDLIIKMMNRFNQQNKELRFGNFIFGPVVMRMFYFLNKPNEALQCFNEPKLEGFFDQLISYQLLMDLLYENKMYKEMLDTFEKIKVKQFEGTKYPKNIVVLTMAACYKINTEESLEIALNLWRDLGEIGHLPMRRAITFIAALALRQGKPEATLEIIASSKNQNYTTIRNLKLAALCNVGRMDEVVPTIKSMLTQESDIKHTYNIDVIANVRDKVQSSDNIELQQEFLKLEQYLKDNGHISDLTLDEQLCTEIATPPFLGNKRKQNQMPQMKYNRYQNFDQGSRRRQLEQTRRPGLVDMN